MGGGSRRAVPSHFFKVILESILVNKMLRVPEKFVRRFGDEISSVVTLIVPHGGVWEVGLKKDERNIWFHDGWNDFVEFHSVCVGHFLVFEYRENSSFHVLIFDKSACEIDYLYDWKEAKNEEQNSVHGDGMEKEGSDEIQGCKTPNKTFSSLKKKIYDECPSNRPSRKTNSPPLQQNWVKHSFVSSLGTKRSHKCAMSLESSKLKHGYETRNKKCKMEESSKMDESRQGKLQGNKMCSSKGSLIHKRRLPRNAESLYASCPLAWNMDCKIDRTEFKTGTRNGKDEPKASYEVGTHSSDDDDFFMDKLELLAYLEEREIFITGTYLSIEKRQRAMDAVRLFKPKNPSFMVILRSKNSYSRYIYVPTKFADKYLRSGTSTSTKPIKIQDSDGREWTVRVMQSHWSALKGGWPAFSRGKNLEEGDVCVFELIRKKGLVFKFSVLSASVE